MKTSQFFLRTSKEAPADTQVISHKLMLRAGMIRQQASGIYTWMPLGMRVLKKVENIVREEMNRSGALEVLMPAVQPAELWRETGRWDDYGPLLLKMSDQNEREFCFGPTHEEMVTDWVRKELHSYKQLPVNFYQIQTKFRDEIRPRFGVMRAREFIMKDAYSFDYDQASLDNSYQLMYDGYCRIFERAGLHYRAVLADTGNIGGSMSHEFQVLAASGEDDIYYSDTSQYAANRELAQTLKQTTPRAKPTKNMEKIATPGIKSIEEVATFLKIPATQTVKTLLVVGENTPIVALLLRGDHQLNEIKAQKLPMVKEPLQFASEADIAKIANCAPGSIGAIDLQIPIIADYATEPMSDFVCGANIDGYHYQFVNWERDLPLTEFADLRNVVVGDPSPDGSGHLLQCRGIEVGHVFQLGTKYSKAMNLTVLGDDGQQHTPLMGCYGIGVTRIVAAAIEQNHDDRGIVFPYAIAPFHIALIPINLQQSKRLQLALEALYQRMRALGFEVLLDDRQERPGVMFADMDLIGIPHRFVLGEKGLDNNTIEYKARTASEVQHIPLQELDAFLESL